MKSDTQEPIKNHEAVVHSDVSLGEKTTSKDTVLFESLYVKERRKSQVLLISTVVFMVLFFVSVAFGLRVADHENRGIAQPGGMMRGDFEDQRGMGSRYYR